MNEQETKHVLIQAEQRIVSLEKENREMSQQLHVFHVMRDLFYNGRGAGHSPGDDTLYNIREAIKQLDIPPATTTSV
jgi:hypothetical protein